MKYYQKHIKVIGQDYTNTTMLAFLYKKRWKSTTGAIISNQKQMHMAIRSQIKICDLFEDLLMLLEELYSALYTSQDHINKICIKVKRWNFFHIDDMRWDFQAAKQYMDDNNIEYIETGESKQHECIKT
eukprot:7486072-Ditylum_brightwellii.AAC.1